MYCTVQYTVQYPGAGSRATRARCRLPGCRARCWLPAAGPAIFRKIFLAKSDTCPGRFPLPKKTFPEKMCFSIFFGPEPGPGNPKRPEKVRGKSGESPEKVPRVTPFDPGKHPLPPWEDPLPPWEAPSGSVESHSVALCRATQCGSVQSHTEWLCTVYWKVYSPVSIM